MSSHQRKTSEQFKIEAIEKHGNSYIYSKSIYINAKTKIEIICKIHGSFWQTPDNHLFGKKGCPRCANAIRNKKTTMNLKQFIEKARLVHGDKFEYSKVIYSNYHSKIEIVCFEHGSFWQEPRAHISFKQGCPKCAPEILSQKNKLTQEEFLEKAKKIHKNLYEYSEVKYLDSHTKVEIICKKHGIFLQTPNGHLSGKGCSKCSHMVSKPEIRWLDEQGILKEYRQYQIKINDKRFKVDGYDLKTNTIYEFLGDFWHGNPKKYKTNDINVVSKKTFGKLLKETIDRLSLLKQRGYDVKYIWESDYR